VWDTKSNSPQPYNSADIDPALEGEYPIQGRTYTTVFAQLLVSQKSYPVSWGSEICGVSESIIKSIATEFATTKPAAIVLGWGGSDKFTNADIAGHAAVILAGITGNFGVPGSGVGGFELGYSGTLASWVLPSEYAVTPTTTAPYDFKRKPNSIHCMINIGDTFQQYFANLKEKEEWIRSLDFILCANIYHCESIKYADIVLPICSKFEFEEEIGGVISRNNHVTIRQRVIDPLFESKSDFYAERAIVEAIGLSNLLPKTCEEYVRYQLDTTDDLKMDGITLDSLLENQGVRKLKGIDKPFRALEGQTYYTPSKRLEVYYESLRQDNQQLPTYEDPVEAYEGNPLRTVYPLQLGMARTRFRIHSQFYDATWLQQFYEPYVELNSIDMITRNFVDGDNVEVFNDRGSFGCPVRTNEAVRPGSARIYEGAWSRYMDSGNYQYVTNDTMLERGYRLPQGPVIPFNDTLVEIRKAEVI
jgi:molybdopterin-containing oxidoreductase family molybdopterin binding subunit